MSIVLQGSTSGSITLQEPAVAGSTVLSLPTGTGTVLTDAKPQSGGVIQVVQNSYSTQTTSSSATYADTGLTATITPKFSTSKILVLVNPCEVQKEGATQVGMKLFRNSTDIYTPFQYAMDTNANTRLNGTLSFAYLDSPSTTSSITYKTQFSNRQAGGTAVYVQADNTPATMTLIEVAA